MVAGMLRHLRSLRMMQKDQGWINTLLQEAENERMHLVGAARAPARADVAPPCRHSGVGRGGGRHTAPGLGVLQHPAGGGSPSGPGYADTPCPRSPHFPAPVLAPPPYI